MYQIDRSFTTRYSALPISITTPFLTRLHFSHPVLPSLLSQIGASSGSLRLNHFSRFHIHTIKRKPKGEYDQMTPFRHQARHNPFKTLATYPIIGWLDLPSSNVASVEMRIHSKMWPRRHLWGEVWPWPS